MIKPQYVRDISDVYTKMYNHPGEEKPLVLQEKALDVEETPNWKKILRGAALKQNRKQPPYAGHSEPREDASEEELVVIYPKKKPVLIQKKVDKVITKSSILSKKDFMIARKAFEAIDKKKWETALKLSIKI